MRIYFHPVVELKGKKQVKVMVSPDFHPVVELKDLYVEWMISFMYRLITIRLKNGTQLMNKHVNI